MRHALITGAAQRLGRAAALDLARAGWGIVVHYRDSGEAANALLAEIAKQGGHAVSVRADLNDKAERHALITHATQKAGAPIIALVNCAAMFEHDTIDTLTGETLERHIALNAFTPSLLAREFAEALPEGARGSVVNFLDFKLASPYPDHFSYTLSKYALAGATELLARALAPKVRVNAVAPGYTLPAPGQPQADFERLHADTPLERGATPEDIAGAVLFLLSAPAVTGQTIHVDAGLRFRPRDRDLSFS